MVTRQSIEIPGLRHGAPIPMASKIGNMLFSSGIMGRDPETQELSEDPDRQAELVFKNMKSLVEQAGGTPENIAHVTVLLKDFSHREHVNKYWEELFPDEHSRPARHVHVEDLRGGMLIQCEIIAVMG